MLAWTLVFHIVGLVFWVGGLLIETIILGRHTQESSPDVRAAFGRLETRLLKGMANPGALLSVITGIILILTNRSYFLHAGWLHAKLVLVLLLIGLHLAVLSRTKAFAAGRIQLERRDCLFLHVAIALTFLVILILVFPLRILFP